MKRIYHAEVGVATMMSSRSTAFFCLGGLETVAAAFEVSVVACRKGESSAQIGQSGG